MLEGLVAHYDQLFILVFFSTIAVIAIAESFLPRRRLGAPMRLRWSGNIGITVLDIALVRLLLPVLMVGAAVWAEAAGWGLFNQWQAAPLLAFLCALVLLDVGRWVQHYLMHRVPLLWRLHRVHHTDQDYDFSTGLRFHPGEALVTSSLDVLVVVALGLPPAAVAVYGLLHAFWAIFAHSNLTIPIGVDRRLRIAFVTPDVHRTHHSAEPGEAMTNFGGITPLWDRLFGTYKDQPARGHLDMVIGLQGYESPGELRLGRMLMLPFTRQPADDAVPSTRRPHTRGINPAG